MKRHNLRLVLLLPCLLFAACGGTGEPPEPTVTPAPTAMPTLSPGAVTVGDLLSRMDAAWAGATSMRTTSWEGDASNTGTPPVGASVTIEQVVRPANRHVVQMVGGMVVDEQIVVDGRVYMKGALVPAAIAPMMDANTWVEIDPAAANSSSPVSALVAYLTAPLTSPVGQVSAETRSLEAVPSGEETMAGRACEVHTFSSGTIDYELAIDGNDLPCRLVMAASGRASLTLFEFNVPGLTITAPDVATPPAA